MNGQADSAPSKRSSIKAEVPGRVLIRGDIDVPEFEQAPGLSHTFVTRFEGAAQAVYEVNTRSRLAECTSKAEVEFQPGSYFFDESDHRLYVCSTSPHRGAQRNRYSVSVLGKHGFALEKPVRVVLEGIAVRGCESWGLADSRTLFGTWGILLIGARDCVVRECTVFLNGGGICVASEAGGGNLVERCTGYGNSSPHNSAECVGVLLYQSKGDVVRDCVGHSSAGVSPGTRDCRRDFNLCRAKVIFDGVQRRLDACLVITGKTTLSSMAYISVRSDCREPVTADRAR